MGKNIKNTSHKNHFIPVFYLNGFLQEDKRLNVFNTITGHSFKNTPNNIAYEKDLYRIERDNIEEDAQERAFGKFEGLAASVIKKINEEKTIPLGEEYNILIEFIALMFSRVPTMIKQASRPVSEITRNVLAIILTNEYRYNTIINRMKEDGVELGGSSSYKAMKEFYESGKFTIEETQNSKVASIIKRIEMIKPFLFERNWSMILTDDAYDGFICSDNPVALISLEELPPLCGPGFGMMNTEVTMPLSKHIALIGRFEKSPKIGVATEHTVATINSRTAMYATRLYYGADDFVFIRKDRSIGRKKDLIQDMNEMNVTKDNI